MNSISIKDRVDLVFRAAAGETHAALVNEYNNAHPDRPIHTYDIKNMIKRLKNTAMLYTSSEAKQLCKKCNKSPINQEDTDKVLHTLNENPHSSVSRTSLITGVPEYLTYKIMKRRGLFPYKMSVMQQLNDNDFTMRMQMCHFFIEKFSQDPDFHKKIIFSDEALFHVNGTFNRQNLRYFLRIFIALSIIILHLLLNYNLKTLD